MTPLRTSETQEIGGRQAKAAAAHNVCMRSMTNQIPRSVWVTLQPMYTGIAWSLCRHLVPPQPTPTPTPHSTSRTPPRPSSAEARSSAKPSSEAAPGREALVAEHNRMLRLGPGVITPYFVPPGAKPFITRSPVEAPKPILVTELCLNKTHRGRVLQGTLIVEPGLMQGVNTILEDAAGTVVYLGLYQCLPEHSLAAAQHYYPKDAVLQIKEPFYKVSGDGTPIVRMDDPMDLAVVVGDADVAAEHWRQGKRHFTRGEYAVAAGCYVKALRAPCPPPPPSNLAPNVMGGRSGTNRGEGGVAPHNGSTKAAAVPVSPKEKIPLASS